MSEMNGPTFTVTASCFNCRHCHSERYQVQGDSGYDVSCSLLNRHIGLGWRTPEWCPFLALAPREDGGSHE